jgi:hypothetical protein
MSSDEPFLGSISELLKDDDIVLSVLSNDGGYGFLLDVIRKSTGEILHALKITLFFEAKMVRGVAEPAVSSQTTQAESAGDPHYDPGNDPHGIIKASILLGPFKLYKKISPRERELEERVFSILNQVFSNGCKLHMSEMCERDQAIRLMEHCIEKIKTSGTRDVRQQAKDINYIKCIIKFLEKKKYTNMTMCLLLLERLYVNPSIPITHKIQKILQIQTAANVLNLLLKGFIGTDLNTNNIVYAVKEQLTADRKRELIAIQARALQLATQPMAQLECKEMLDGIISCSETPVIIDSGVFWSCEKNFIPYFISEKYKRFCKKLKPTNPELKRQFKKDMELVQTILSNTREYDVSALSPHILGYLLMIILDDNLRNDWLGEFPFGDITTLTVIKYLIQAENEYRKSHEPLVPLLQVPGRELKTIADYKQYAKMLIDEEVPSGGGKVTQSVKSSYIDNLYKFTPLKNQSAPEGRIDSSTKLPVTDLNRAPQRGADSNLHRYKKTKKRKLKIKKNVKNKSYKVRRT